MYRYAYTIASHCSFMESHLCLIYSYTQLVLANCDMFLYTFVNCDLSYVSNVYRKESVIMCQQRICTHLWSVLLCQYVFIQPCELVIFYSADLIVEGSANISHLCVPCWSWLLKYAVCTRLIFSVMQDWGNILCAMPWHSARYKYGVIKIIIKHSS